MSAPRSVFLVWLVIVSPECGDMGHPPVFDNMEIMTPPTSKNIQIIVPNPIGTIRKS